jgi:predicted transposase YdaD
MAVLWLRFLTEIDEHTQEVPRELLDNPDMCQALQILEKAGYNDAQLQAYSDFWMSLVDERVLREGSYKKGIEKGMAEGMAKGMAEGMAKGMAEGLAKGLADTARNLKAMGLSLADISKATGLTIDEIADL